MREPAARRVALPTTPFNRKRHWLDWIDTSRRGPMASAPPVGHLYEIAWEVVDAPVSATDGTWLLMGGDDALADALSAGGLDLRWDPAVAAGRTGGICATGLEVGVRRGSAMGRG